MTTRSSVERFLAEREPALAGASRSGRKFGNAGLNRFHRWIRGVLGKLPKDEV